MRRFGRHGPARKPHFHLNLPFQVAEYTTLCTKLAGVMGRMSGQLTTLSYDYADLAKTLDDWPAGEGPTSAATSSSSAVGSAMRRTALATQTLAARLSAGPENAWHDAANFGEAVKGVLKNRDSIQVIWPHRHITRPSRLTLLLWAEVVSSPT